MTVVIQPRRIRTATRWVNYASPVSYITRSILGLKCTDADGVRASRARHENVTSLERCWAAVADQSKLQKAY